MEEPEQLRSMFAAISKGDFTFRVDTTHPMASEANAAMEYLDRLMLQELKTTVEATAAGFETTIAMGKLDQSTHQIAERSEAMAAATEEMHTNGVRSSFAHSFRICKRLFFWSLKANGCTIRVLTPCTVETTLFGSVDFFVLQWQGITGSRKQKKNHKPRSNQPWRKPCLPESQKRTLLLCVGSSDQHQSRQSAG